MTRSLGSLSGRKALAVALVLLAAAAACWLILDKRNSEFDPLAILNHPERLTLYSIDGDAVRHDRKLEGAEDFHGAPVLGKVEITDGDARAAITQVLKRGMETPESAKECFWPRHALRVVSGRRTVDFLICFECSQIYAYEGSSRLFKPVSRTPQPVFNRYLREAGLPLSKGMAPDL